MINSPIHRRSLVAKNQAYQLYQGILAESYDGIGRYAAVSLNRGGTSSALRCAVTSGSIKSGRVFPAGTPVILYARQGHLEILTLGAGGGPELVYHRESPYDVPLPNDIMLPMVASAETLGLPSLGRSMKLVGIVDADEFVTPPVVLATARIVPIGIVSSELVGWLNDTWPIRPTSIGSLEVMGAVRIQRGISPTGIASGEALGSPTRI